MRKLVVTLFAIAAITLAGALAFKADAQTSTRSRSDPGAGAKFHAD